jgi:hypothetical protein
MTVGVRGIIRWVWGVGTNLNADVQVNGYVLRVDSYWCRVVDWYDLMLRDIIF